MGCSWTLHLQLSSLSCTGWPVCGTWYQLRYPSLLHVWPAWIPSLSNREHGPGYQSVSNIISFIPGLFMLIISALKGDVPVLLTVMGFYLWLLLINFKSAISFAAYSISASEVVQISGSTLAQTLLTENFPTGRPNYSIVYYLLLDHCCSTCRKEGNNRHINIGRVFEMVRTNWRLGCYRCLFSWRWGRCCQCIRFCCGVWSGMYCRP